MTRDQRLLTRPLYLQVRDILVERMTAGVWKPGSLIPNEQDLAKELGVSQGTVRRALDELETEHLISRRQGRGTFVNDQKSERFLTRFNNLRGPGGEPLNGSIRVLTVEAGFAEPPEQMKLGLKSSDKVVRVNRVRSQKDGPYLCETVYLPQVKFPGLETRLETSHPISALAQDYKILLRRAEERVEISMADEPVATALSIRENTAVIKLDRVVHSIDEEPVEWRVAYCHPQKVHYRIDLI